MGLVSNVDVLSLFTAKRDVDVIIRVRKLRDVDIHLATADILDADLLACRNLECADLGEVCARFDRNRLPYKRHVAADDELCALRNGHGRCGRGEHRRANQRSALNVILYVRLVRKFRRSHRKKAADIYLRAIHERHAGRVEDPKRATRVVKLARNPRGI